MATKSVDFRRGADGLAALMRAQVHHDWAETILEDLIGVQSGNPACFPDSRHRHKVWWSSWARRQFGVDSRHGRQFNVVVEVLPVQIGVSWSTVTEAERVLPVNRPR